MVRPEELRSSLGCEPVDTASRVLRACKDPVLIERAAALAAAPDDEKGVHEAQIETYLAAAHILFPEEANLAYGVLKDE